MKNLNRKSTKPQSVIPWRDAETWSQVQLSVQHICGALGKDTEKVHELAQQIAEGYADMELDMERLCQQTCTCCMEICCLKATVWYDLRDVLFIHLVSGRLPGEQITRKSDTTCCNLSTTGCMRSRNERPFICTWYICSSQKAVLTSMDDEIHQDQTLSQKITDVQHKRKLLEDMCIRAVCVG